MLKKAGILVAAAAAGLLAAAPFALATDGGMSEGGANVAGNGFDVPVDGCNTDTPHIVDAEDISFDLGVFGEAEATTEEGDGGQRTCDEPEGDDDGADDGAHHGDEDTNDRLVGGLTG